MVPYSDYFAEKAALNGGGVRSGGKPNSGDGRVIRVINADQQSVKERVLLNLKTKQPFEEVLIDLGQVYLIVMLLSLFLKRFSRNRHAGSKCMFLNFPPHVVWHEPKLR
jgi:hypothetical protein